MIAWRIEKKKRLADARSGEGARLAGGRWNSPGLGVIYASQHLSLAVLEILVHAPLPAQRTVARSRTVITVPDALAEEMPLKRLPRDFGPETPYDLTRALGDRWLREQRSAALVVPSAIVPSEKNILLNPAHPAFARCAWEDFAEIRLDPRLWRAA